MSQAAYQLRVGITLAGTQPVSLDTHHREPGEGPSHLCVGFGPVLVYCQTPDSVLLHYNAISAARDAMDDIFPDGWTSQLASSDRTDPYPAIASVTSQPGDSFTITRFGPRASRSREPELVLTIGPLTLVFRDAAAVVSVHDVLNNALNMAPLLWPQATRPKSTRTNR